MHIFKNAPAFLLRGAQVKYVMQLHDILQLRTSVILPEAISDGELAPI